MHRLMLRWALLTLHISSTFIQGQVSLVQFYPYGILAGDSQLLRQDDASNPVSIQFAFPFFDSTYRVVHISTNGQVNFGNGDSAFVRDRFR